VIAIDTEGYDPHLKETGSSVRTGGYTVGISVATPDKAWYFPYRHGHEGPGNMDPEKVLSWAASEQGLCNPKATKVFANAIYDMDFLAEAGVHINGKIEDVLFGLPLVDEYSRYHSLAAHIQHFLPGHKGKDDAAMYEWAAVAFGGKPDRNANAKNIWRIPPALVGPYAEEDARATLALRDPIRKALEPESLGPVYDLECSLLPLMLAMRRRGVRVDTETAATAGIELRKQADIAQAALNTLCGSRVDVWANASIAFAFDKLGVSYTKTAAGSPSFTAPWLKSCTHPAAALILEIRQLEKVGSTFISGIERFAVNGRVHTQFHQLRSDDGGACSGRFSSSLPNLQNIPVRHKTLGPLMRSIFIPDDGEDMYRDDYSQIEFRLGVHYGEGEDAEIMRDEYRKDPDTDYHTLVAELAAIDRTPAKTVNFGVFYGMGKKTLARNLGWTEEQTIAFLEKYHAAIPFARALLLKASMLADTRGWVKTLAGRRARFNNWEPREYNANGIQGGLPLAQAKREWPDEPLKRAFTYAALNRVLQGSAADMMKTAMKNIWESGVCNVLGAPLLSVHDELLFSVPRTKEGEEAHAEAVRLMETAIPLKIPVTVSTGKGSNWQEAH
jgi:DNA polymerase I-like protein with 3'-5' exonuclease and polymerase domains